MYVNDAYAQNTGVIYNCGDCGSEVMLRPGDIVICRECGYRILYKKRTKQSAFTLLCSRSHDDIFSAVVQFEAR
eukprot:31079-Pelagococcus_subviridis.AAC.12